MYRFLVFSALGVGLGYGQNPVGRHPDVPLRALLVAGGCCHDYAKQAVILRDGLQARANVQVDVVLSQDGGTNPHFPMYLSPDWAKGYDVVIHDECAADSKDPAYVANVLAPHQKGLPAVNLHCAMHSYRTTEPVWVEFLGIHSTAHGPQRPIRIEFAGAAHEATKGVADWTTGNEELYNNAKVLPTAKPLAMGHQDMGDGKTESSVVVWTNDYRGTRVFNTTIGHNNETVGDARYLDLLAKGLLWSSKSLTPASLKPYAGPAGRFEVVPAKRAGGLADPPADATKVQVTVSSTQGGNDAWRALDGAKDTRWCAGGPELPQWYQLAFAEPRKVSGMNLTWENAGSQYAFKIEGSTDGKQWSVLAEKNLGPAEIVVGFPETVVKFLKVTATGSTNGQWGSISELSVKGEGIGRLFPELSDADKRKAEAADKNANNNSRPVIERLTTAQEAEILKDVKVADGFDVSLFASSSAANYPVYVAAAPNGDLYVASDGNGSGGQAANYGRIIRLRDEDGDGRADEAIEFVKNVDSPRGMVWDHDRLYVIHPPDISCYIDHDGDGQADEQKTLIKGIAFGFPDRPADHTTNGLSIGIDGWLYIAGGDFGFKEAVGTDGRKVQHRAGGVIRFRPDGSGLEVFSTGTRNILGTPVSPLLDLFARDNTNDGGGWDVRFHHFTGLEDHGYPRLYMNFGDEIVKPLADYGGGSGCGATYLSEPGFPTEWNNAPLTCDWGSNALWHHQVEPAGATFRETEKPKALIRMTRPTDADVDGMSRLYQASWKGATFVWEGPDVGYVVRVTPKGYVPEPLPDFEKADVATLVRLLESPSQVRTLEAQRTLLRRPGTPEMRDALLVLAKDAAKPLPARVAALYALTQRGVKADQAGAILPLVTPLASDPALQRFVLRALGDMGLDKGQKGVAPASIYSAGLKSPDARTRLEAIVGATRQNLASQARGIAPLLGDADPVVAHTAFQGMARLKGWAACFELLDSKDATAAQKTGALRALMRMHEPEVVKGLIARLAAADTPETRAGLVGALARLHFHEGPWKGDSWGTRPDTRGPYYQPEPWEQTPVIAAALQAQLKKAPPAEVPAMIRELKRNRVNFEDSLERLLASADKDASVLPELVSQLVAAEAVPAGAVPLLLKALKSEDADTVARAIAVLAKTDSNEGCVASLDALGRLAANDRTAKQLESARKAFLASPKLESHHGLLEEQAEKLSGDASCWADVALLNLSVRQGGTPESKELSAKAVAAGWDQPKRKVQLLKAIRLSDFHGLDDRVLVAAKDPDAAVAAAAGETVKSLKLDAKAADKTPLVGTLPIPEAVAQAVAMKGDIALGKQVFNRCTICHAVSMDEPQKGPFLGTIAQTYTRAQLADNILEPGKTIAQGFATELFTLKDGSAQMGFVTFESAEQVKIRTITSQEFSWKVSEIAKREKQPISLMPPGLVNDATVRDFASLLDYLESLSKR